MFGGSTGAVRRRIYISPEGLEDTTIMVYLFEDDDDDGHTAICRRRALYNEPLWQRYVAAREALSLLHMEVCAALVTEPYDEVELDLKAQSLKVFDENDYMERIRAIEAVALANARAQEPK